MKFLNYDGVATLWEKIVAKINSLMSSFGEDISIGYNNDVVTPTYSTSNYYYDGSLTKKASNTYRLYSITGDNVKGIERIVAKIGCNTNTLTNGICMIMFYDGTHKIAAPNTVFYSQTVPFKYFEAVVPPGTTGIYISHRNSAGTAEIRAIMRHADDGLIGKEYAFGEKIIDLASGYSVGTIDTETMKVVDTSGRRFNTVALEDIGVNWGDVLKVKVINKSKYFSVVSYVGFVQKGFDSDGVLPVEVGDDVMEDGLKKLTTYPTDLDRELTTAVVVPRFSTHVIIASYCQSSTNPTIMELYYGKRVDEIGERTQFMYSGVLAQGKKLRFPAGATGKATFWNDYPRDGECGSIREVLVGYDPDGAQGGGVSGIYSVLNESAIDDTVAPDEALSISVVDDCVVATAVDGTSYYTVLSSIEPEVI